MGLKPLEIFISVNVGTDFRRQNLTSKVGPGAEIKQYISAEMGSHTVGHVATFEKQ